MQDEALLEGHFRLSNGMHSPSYLQCAKVFQHPEHAELIAKRQSAMVGRTRVDAVVGPAVGGIIAAYELARSLCARALFAERQEDAFTLRRGFAIAEGEKVIVAEDVISTGGGAKDVIALVRRLGGEVIAVTSVVNRSGGNPFDVPFYYLHEFTAPTWPPEECPLCREGQPVEKPGSRAEVG